MKLDWAIPPKLKEKMTLLTDVSIPTKYEELFCQATSVIAPFVEPKPLTIFFVRDTLTVHLTVADRIAEYWPDVIIYNLARIDMVSDERDLMVIFLEELVHAYFDTLDESFVGFKVAEIYPKVRFNPDVRRYEFA